MKTITIELPDDALAGIVTCVSGNSNGVRLKSNNFDFHVEDGTTLTFEDELASIIK